MLDDTLGQLDLRGSSSGNRLSSAEATSRLVQEQLRTDVFATAVAEASGLGSALETGLISTGSIRRNLSAGANGDSLVVIKASWTDPVTAQSLAQAAIETYRDYVVESFNQDKPYDDFIREQLAGDLLSSGGSAQRRRELLTATGFLMLGPKMLAEVDTDKLECPLVYS